MNTLTLKAVAEKLMQEVPTLSAEDALYFAKALLSFVSNNKVN
jgi:hypothetical protein